MAKKVLIIENSVHDAKLEKEFLEKEKFIVDVATTGKEGLEKISKAKPDLVVLDLVLPDMTGYDVCRKIRKDKTFKDMLVIILSIKSDIADIAKAFSEGADDYIVKPPLPEILARKLKLYLRAK